MLLNNQTLKNLERKTNLNFLEKIKEKTSLVNVKDIENDQLLPPKKPKCM